MARKNQDDIDNFHEYDVYIPTRTIYFPVSESGELDETSAAKVIKNLHLLESLGDLPIKIILNNCGGDFFQAMAIYDAIRGCKSTVIIKVYGTCMSAATLILQAGDERHISQNSTFMMHIGESGYHDHSHNLKRWVKYEEQVLEPLMKKIYLDRMKVKRPSESDKKIMAKVDSLLTFDTILTPQEVVELGLADNILD